MLCRVILCCVASLVRGYSLCFTCLPCILKRDWTDPCDKLKSWAGSEDTLCHTARERCRAWLRERSRRSSTLTYWTVRSQEEARPRRTGWKCFQQTVWPAANKHSLGKRKALTPECALVWPTWLNLFWSNPSTCVTREMWRGSKHVRSDQWKWNAIITQNIPFQLYWTWGQSISQPSKASSHFNSNHRGKTLLVSNPAINHCPSTGFVEHGILTSSYN